MTGPRRGAAHSTFIGLAEDGNLRGASFGGLEIGLEAGVHLVRCGGAVRAISVSRQGYQRTIDARPGNVGEVIINTLQSGGWIERMEQGARDPLEREVDDEVGHGIRTG